ncbi:ABC transporter permease, partial [bacterium]|nr:ABC transporter permease [bacterium]
MFKNWLVIAYRYSRRHATHSIIGILGLTLGLTSCLLIFTFVRHELSYDNFHTQAERTFRINYIMSEPDGMHYYNATPNALADAISKEVPGVKHVARIQLSFREGVVKIDNQFFSQSNIVYVEPAFLDMFDYEVLAGSPLSRLADPETVILTESVARKYFGEELGLGQMIQLGDDHNLEITGIVADPPSNSHLPFQFFVSLATLRKTFDQWTFSDGNVTYVTLDRNYPLKQIESSLNLIRQRYQDKEYAEKTTFALQPLRKIHTDTKYGAYPGSYTINATYLWGLTLVGVLIILSASINYINLSTAQAGVRAREVGVRKALGSRKAQLVWQFMSETVFLTLLSVIISLPLAYWLLQYISPIFHLEISSSALLSPLVLLFLAVVAIAVSFLAGFYPAFILSGYGSISALKGIVTGTKFRQINLRRSLVLFQLIVSQALIMGVIIVFSQIDYIKNKALGFDREARIILRIPDNETGRQAFRNTLMQINGIEGVTYAMGGPTKSGTLSTTVIRKSAAGVHSHATRTIPIDAHYLDVFDIPLVAGQGLEPRHEIAPVSHVALINESMVTELAFSHSNEALGTVLTLNDFEVEVIGVVGDFHQKSLHSRIAPAVLLYWPQWTHYAGIEINSQNLQKTILSIEDLYKEVFPDAYFSYYFLDDYLKGLYRAEESVFNGFKVFTLVAILIAFIGLY